MISLGVEISIAGGGGEMVRCKSIEAEQLIYILESKEKKKKDRYFFRRARTSRLGSGVKV